MWGAKGLAVLYVAVMLVCHVGHASDGPMWPLYRGNFYGCSEKESESRSGEDRREAFQDCCEEAGREEEEVVRVRPT